MTPLLISRLAALVVGMGLSASMVVAQPNPLGMFRALPPVAYAPQNGFPLDNLCRLGDINGDGYPDLVIGSGVAAPTALGQQLLVLLGNGDGTFASPISSFHTPPLAGRLTPMRLVDVDGDGDLDVIAWLTPTASIVGAAYVFHNIGGGQLLPGPLRLGGQGAAGFEASDLDGDGRVEFVYTMIDTTVNAVAPLLKIVVDRYDPFAQSYTNVFTYYEAYYFPIRNVVVGDFNGDGLQDIGYTRVDYSTPALENSVRVLLRVPGTTLNFVPTAPIVVPTLFGVPQPAATNVHRRVAPGEFDFDGDGFDDYLVLGGSVATAGGGGPAFWIFRGAPNGLDPNPRIIGPAAPFPTALSLLQFDVRPEVADFDLDGHLDVLLNGLVHRLTRGSDSVGAQVHATQVGPMINVAVGDVDLDGDMDVVFVEDVPIASGPVGFWVHTALNETILRKTCPGSLPFTMGTATPGNPYFTVRVQSPTAGGTAIFGLSTGRADLMVNGCHIGIDLTPIAPLSPTLDFGVFITDASGKAETTFALPNDPVLIGQSLYAQWLATTTPGPITLAGQTWTPSDTRMIFFW